MFFCIAAENAGPHHSDGSGAAAGILVPVAGPASARAPTTAGPGGGLAPGPPAVPAERLHRVSVAAAAIAT